MTSTKREIQMEESWKTRLKDEFSKDYMNNLRSFLDNEIKSGRVFYPRPKEIFNALDLTPFEETKVVLIGQDPYHGPGQAHGLCFSVNEGVRHPPSLMNIFKELKSDLDIDPPKSGNLTKWAKQGVLLLNATLTVGKNSAGSHQRKGWEEFTDQVIQTLNSEKENLVFILWGSYAQKKGQVIDTKKHFVIKSPHPSPLSAHRGFFGSRPFSKTNQYLKSKDLIEINWSL